MRFASSVALLAALASTTACTMSRRAATVSMVAGSAVAIGGMSMFASSGNDSDMDGRNENILNDDLDAMFGGSLLALAGVALLVAGATSQAPEDESSAHVAAPRRRPASVTWTPEVMPYDYVPGDPPGKTVESAPPPPPRASLPEVATTDAILRMAQQARAAVERGNCDAAWVTWDAMNARDPRYAAALAAGPVLAPCPRSTSFVEQ